MKEGEEIFLVKGGLGVAHGRVTADTGRVKLLVLGGLNFLFFSSFLDIYLQNKTKQKQLNSWVASHEALV